jgi:hypothetical protein
MNDTEKLKIYTAIVENTRKWVTIMDTKAGFISALNAGLISFIWAGGKLVEGEGLHYVLAILATLFSFASLIIAVWIIIPRATLFAVFKSKTAYKPEYKAISFYGYVANNYPKKDFSKFITDVKNLSDEDLIGEVLEQHFTTSHIANTKSRLAKWAGLFLLGALFLTFSAIAARVFV